MSIAATLDALVAIQEGLSITDPEPATIKRAIDSYPDSNQPVPDSDLPCWLNEWEMTEGIWGAGGAREMHYQVHAILLVGDTTVQVNQRMRIATEFWEALVTALRDNQLGDTDQHMEIQRATQGRVVVFGRAYVGLEVWLTVQNVGTGA